MSVATYGYALILHIRMYNNVTGFWKTTEISKISHLAYFILLAQLIATLIHYPCNVALTGLAEWSAFLELILPTM